MTWRAPRGVLAELVEAAREDARTRHGVRPTLPNEVLRAARRPGGRFVAALRETSARLFPLICEVKKASPSAGALAPTANATEVAQRYASAGAACVSVLTEARRFGGSLDDLRAVRGAVDVPLLRKDFVVDPYMVYEAAEAGADAVLLIVAALEPARLVELADLARELGLDVLLELIFERDLEALALRPWDLVGVNARDLETLEVDPGRFGRLAPEIAADGRILVAESGVRTPEDVRRHHAEGARAALVGEALMRSADPAEQVRRLAGALA